MNKVLLFLAGFVAVYAKSVDASSAQLAEAVSNSDSAAHFVETSVSSERSWNSWNM